ncbi:MAG: hypothetical protein R3F33_00340 [Planctomycetota bacterium]
MSQMPTQEEQSRWHRFFAIDCNNSAWGLVENSKRSADQDADLLRRAYAAAHHWFQVGDDVNKNRAEGLLGQAHACLGHGELAMHYAQRNHDFVLGRDSDAWEVAFAHSVLSHAASAAGQSALHAEQYGKAQAVAESLGGQDRQIFDSTFHLVPKP